MFLPPLLQCPFLSSARTRSHARARRHTHTHTHTHSLASSTYQFRFSALQKFFHIVARGLDQGYPKGRRSRWRGEERSDWLLPPAAQRRLWRWLRPRLLSPRAPCPTPALPRLLWAFDSALLRKVDVPPGAPGRAPHACWHAPAGPELRTGTRGRVC